MKIEPFLMERWQSLHEHDVEINLSDSGVHPLAIRDFIDDPAELEEVVSQRLIYTQTNGTPELRETIAALYSGATPDNVEAMSGGAEANFIAVWTLLEPGDEVVVMIPNYMQIVGIVRGLGGVVKEWRLQPDHEAKRWVADLDELRRLVTSRTKLIAICNPDNPTGSCLDGAELDTICKIAAGHGAWVLSDEIYQGLESNGQQTPTLWGRSDRVIVTNSLSKAYGLPGLRLGWLVAPARACADFWAHHDYTTIGPGTLSDLIATKALQPARRAQLLDRARRILQENLTVAVRWLEEHSATIRHIPPRAGAVLYFHYAHPINSTTLAERLLAEKSVLVVPGDHFGMDHWLRIGFGGEAEHIEAGLQRIGESLESLAGRNS